MHKHPSRPIDAIKIGKSFRVIKLTVFMETLHIVIPIVRICINHIDIVFIKVINSLLVFR